MTRQDIGQLIPLALRMVNSLGVENASVSLKSGPKGLRVQVEFRDVTLRSGSYDGVAVDEGLLHIEDLDPTAEPRAMLAGATVRVERLLVRVSASLVNRLLDSDLFQEELRRRVPIEVRNLELQFGQEQISFRGQVRKGLSFPFLVELGMAAIDNRLRVTFKQFWAAEMVPLPAFARRLVMSVARHLLEGRRELAGLVRIEEDYAEVNPWPKVPVRMDAEFTRFGVEGHFLVIEMGPSGRVQGQASPLPETPQALRPVPTPAPIPVPAAPEPRPPAGPPA